MGVVLHTQTTYLDAIKQKLEKQNLSIDNLEQIVDDLYNLPSEKNTENLGVLKNVLGAAFFRPVDPEIARTMIAEAKTVNCEYKSAPLPMLHSETFKKEEIEALIKNLSDGDGIRIYLGLSTSVDEQNSSLEKPHFTTILVAIKNKQEQIPPNGVFSDGLIEYGTPCPPRCRDAETKFGSHILVAS